MNTINIGIIGAGRIGKVHAENLVMRVPGAYVIAVADVNLPAAQELGAKLQIPAAMQDYQLILSNPDVQLILSNPDVQAVVICSATNTHSQIITEAAQAGKHIFCEKPIDFDLSRIDAALTAVEQAKVKLQIGFNRRFDPNFARVREAVVSGRQS